MQRQLKSERREKRKRRRNYKVHGRRLAELLRNALFKRSVKK